MKTTSRWMFLLFGLVSLSATMFAGTENVLNMHVPFSFVAGGKALPAGDYRFVEVAENGLVMIKGSTTATSVALITTPGALVPQDAERGAKFQRKGDVVYLEAIQLDGRPARVVRMKPVAAPSSTELLGGGQ